MHETQQVKITTYVPPEAADAVRSAIGQAGAGAVGNYSFCSYSVLGKGRFEAAPGAHPAAGKVGGMQIVPEERIEVICDRRLAGSVVQAIQEIHPYEVVPVDVVSLIALGDL